MKNIKIDGLQFEIFLSSSEITKRVVELATVLKNVYNNKWPVFLVVLNGALFFAGELLKNIDNFVELSCVKVHSYDGVMVVVITVTEEEPWGK